MSEPVPVFWWSENRDSPASGYWDQAIVQDLLSNQLWATGLEFDHRHDRPDCGSIVVVPGRQQYEDEDASYIEDLRATLAPLPWVLLVVTGDEEGRFPYPQIDHPRMIVWGQVPRTDRVYPYPIRWVPMGYAPGTVEAIRELWDLPISAVERPLSWCFAGQATHEMRTDLVDALEQTGLAGALHTTESFGAGWSWDRYAREMLSSRVAPAPCGPVTPESFRLYEAIEAGCVPIVDSGPVETLYPRKPLFWHALFGAEFPIPVVETWVDVESEIEAAQRRWRFQAAVIRAWWLEEKERMALDLVRDVGELRGGAMSSNEITVLMTTSPVPSNPSLDKIAETIGSIRAQSGLAGSTIVIACDGVRPEQAAMAEAYEEYLERLTWECMHNPAFRGCVLVIAREWLHQARLTVEALRHVYTDLVLFIEHDMPICGTVDWAGIAGLVGSGDDIDLVRLSHESEILEPHRHLALDGGVKLAYPYGVSLARTVQWSQRPHMVRTEWYRSVLEEFFPESARTMIEDRMHGVCQDGWPEATTQTERERIWQRFRLAVYAPPGSWVRSFHIDGREGEPKYEMRYE